MNFSRFQSFVCAVIFCAACTAAISLDSTPKTPLSVSNPISGDASTATKDLRREESRYNNEPPPEFYKGPGSAAASKDRYGFQTSNDAAEHRFDAVSSTNAVPYGSSGFGGSRWGSSGSGGSRDRFGSGGNGGSGYYGSSGLGGSGLGGGYDRPRGQYGPPQTVDLPGGYYSNDYNGHGNSYGGGGHDIWAEKWQHLSKSNLVPIASAALLGIAAAFLFNPVLLQLGTISAGKRRRRETSEQSEESQTSEESNEIESNESYSHDLAYKRQMPQ